MLALLLGLAKRVDQKANLFLSVALVAIVLRTGGVTAFVLPALGPLLYFYVRQINKPELRVSRKDLLHFCPLLVTFWIPSSLVLISVIFYLYLSHRLIQNFYRRLRPVLMDRPRFAFRRLEKALFLLGLVCVLSLFNDFFYLIVAFVLMGMAMEAMLKPDIAVQLSTPINDRMDAREKGRRLKETVATNRFYEDPELTLTTLAVKLRIAPHDLSRIINTGLEKNFNDFINEFRVREIVWKMSDPDYDRMTLLGIAYEAGFNSKTTFNRVFKEMTGKTPVEFKNSLKKEVPNDNLAPRSRIRPVTLRSDSPWNRAMVTSKRNNMFRNYLKVAWRNMLHSKVYSLLNIIGLAVGMTVALIIGLWIFSQYSFNRFLPGYDRLYQVKLNFYYSDGIRTQTGSSLPLIEELRKNYPEVKFASETDWGGQHSLVIGDKKLYPWGLVVGTDFLKMFPFPMLKGNESNAFADANSIILTESVAKALFGNDDPLNKTIRVDNKSDVVVTGVMKDVPPNSTLQFSYLLPYSYIEQTYPRTKKDRVDWGNYSFPEYLELQPGTDAVAFENKIKNIIVKHTDKADEKVEVILQPAKNWRLLTQFKNGKATDGFIWYVRLFAIIGILVLVIACINFVNLSTARAEKRAREVGVRKAIGSSRRNLIIQFLMESLLVTFLSFVVSILIAQLLLPSFNNLTNSSIVIPYGKGMFWLIMLGYLLITALLAGCRPAFYLSSFQPVRVLKGTVQMGKGATLPRKILVVVQFSCSIALIISTLVIYQQIDYAKNRPKGYNPDNLLMMNSSDDLNRNYDVLKRDLLQSGQVISVTRSASNMSYFPASFSIRDFPGKKTSESLEMATSAISPDYFKTIGTKFISGHDYATGAGADTSNLIINEAAAERLRLKEPLNQLITFNYSKNPMRIIGVVENAIVGSPFYSAEPALYVYNPGWSGAIMFRINPAVNKQDAIKKIAPLFNKYNPSYPFDYRFADEAYTSSYKLEELVGTLAGIFAGLAIFISCLGLFGLAAYMAEQRKKEIGIRKVLGASVSQIWVLLSRDFVALVIISGIIASAVAFYFLHGWLEKYDYRISIGPSAFLVAIIVTVIITIITVSYQAINTGLTNPVKSLRTE